MKERCFIIPAVKKNVAFPDDLIKKLDGIQLIQRAINLAKQIEGNQAIYIITDSEEIGLICQRNQIPYVRNPALKLQHSEVWNIPEIQNIIVQYQNVVVLWPHAPLITVKDIQQAYFQFCQKNYDILVTLRNESHRIFREPIKNAKNVIEETHETVLIEVKAFSILKSAIIGRKTSVPVAPYLLPTERAVEIQSYQDWWVCEKLLRRKRIVFRVIGYNEVGMGHIYRALSLAHEISDHEIYFVCGDQSLVAVNMVAGKDYFIRCVPEVEVTQEILGLKPDLVVNDILNTPKAYVAQLQKAGIKVVNFEDIGEGAQMADLTFNEIYEDVLPGPTIHWGSPYFILRDEFIAAKPHRFKKKIDSVLISFGGTDPHNHTQTVFRQIWSICQQRRIKIYIVMGPGYLHKEGLLQTIQETEYTNVEYTSATGVISSIMEKTPIAICANGRTVYELAHMNIPAIIISHHEREQTHAFADHGNGFIHLGTLDPQKHELLKKEFTLLIQDTTYRKRLFEQIKKYDFSKNKSKVVKMILSLIET